MATQPAGSGTSTEVSTGETRKVTAFADQLVAAASGGNPGSLGVEAADYSGVARIVAPASLPSGPYTLILPGSVPAVGTFFRVASVSSTEATIESVTLSGAGIVLSDGSVAMAADWSMGSNSLQWDSVWEITYASSVLSIHNLLTTNDDTPFKVERVVGFPSTTKMTLQPTALILDGAITMPSLGTLTAAGLGVIGEKAGSLGTYPISGTTWPSSPTTNDTFFHQTYGEWFYWDGTYWLGPEKGPIECGKSSSTPSGSGGFFDSAGDVIHNNSEPGGSGPTMPYDGIITRVAFANQSSNTFSILIYVAGSSTQLDVSTAAYKANFATSILAGAMDTIAVRNNPTGSNTMTRPTIAMYWRRRLSP